VRNYFDYLRKSNCYLRKFILFENKNMRLRNIKILLVILLSIMQISIATGTNSQLDSIRKKLPHLSGKEKLVALNNLCQIAGNINDSTQELNCIKAYMLEARKQGNIGEEAYARELRLNCLYNYYMRDQMARELPENLSFFSEHKLWQQYYSKWTLIVEMYLYDGKFHTALREVEEIYNDARNRKNNYGIGISLSCLGKTYLHMRMDKEAARKFEAAVKYLKKNKDNATDLVDTYRDYCVVLNNLKEYAKEGSIALEWKKVLDGYKERYKKEGTDISALDDFYRKCYGALGLAETGLHDFKSAKPFLEMAMELSKDSSPLAQVDALDNLSTYCIEAKEYEQALKYEAKRFALDSAMGNDFGLIGVYEKRADIYMRCGMKAQAADEYEKLIPLKDSLNASETSSQLNELSTLFKVDQLKLEKRASTYKLYAAIIVCLLLIVILVTIIIYARRLNKKNRIIYERLRETHRREDSAAKAAIESQKTVGDTYKQTPPDANISPDSSQPEQEEVIYQCLNNIMQKEELFKNPLLGRDDLAAKVGTNRSYLLDIIKNCSEDKSITDFINGYRLTQCFCHADEKSGIIHHRNWGIIRLQFPQFFQSGFSWEGTE
jgi:predicted negative regulator of RcsB-dependent stress response